MINLRAEYLRYKYKDKIIGNLHKLSIREQDILLSRIGEKEFMTLQQLGDKYGISRERIRAIESQAIKRIK